MRGTAILKGEVGLISRSPVVVGIGPSFPVENPTSEGVQLNFQTGKLDFSGSENN